MPRQTKLHAEAPEKRSSLRLRGLPPPSDTVPPPPKPVLLPTELRLAVLGYLGKHDLKQVRLVSKEWSILAAMPLFDRVYVSLHDVDMQVFKNVTEHPILSQGIKELIHDPSTFVLNEPYQLYFYRFCQQLSNICCFWEERKTRDLEPRIKAFLTAIREVWVGATTNEDIYKEYGQDSFFIEAHQNWEALAKSENSSIGYKFYTDLRTGMQNLKNLWIMKIDNSIWNENIEEASRSDGPVSHAGFSGSPLARQWNPMHLRPEPLNTFIERHDELVMSHFQTYTRAISETGRNIRLFDFGNSFRDSGVPRLMFKNAEIDKNMRQHWFNAFANLETLILNIETEPDFSLDSHENPLGILPDLLDRIPRLKLLRLIMTRSERYFTCHEIFPPKRQWPCLKTLSLTGLAADGLDFTKLLCKQMPGLRRLSLSDIELTKGTWEGFVEFLVHLHLQKVSFFPYGRFKHRNGAIWRPCIQNSLQTDVELLAKTERYVVYGGLHPCLPPGSEPASSTKYCQELFEDHPEILRVSNAFTKALLA